MGLPSSSCSWVPGCRRDHALCPSRALLALTLYFDIFTAQQDLLIAPSPPQRPRAGLKDLRARPGNALQALGIGSVRTRNATRIYYTVIVIQLSIYIVTQFLIHL